MNKEYQQIKNDSNTRRQSMSMNLCDIRIVMLGQCGVGKTSITNQYVKGQFDREYVPSSMTYYYKPDVEIEKNRYSLEIIDTMGNEENYYDDPLLDQWIYMGDAFGLVYQQTNSSIINQNTLIWIQKLIEKIYYIKKTHETPISLIQNQLIQTTQDILFNQKITSIIKNYQITHIKTNKDLQDQKLISNIFEPLVLQYKNGKNSLNIHHNSIFNINDQISYQHYCNKCCNIY